MYAPSRYRANEALETARAPFEAADDDVRLADLLRRVCAFLLHWPAGARAATIASTVSSPISP